MAITTMSIVKTLANMFDKSGTGAPTIATVGEVGDSYLDTVTGLTYECTDDSDPYVWQADTQFDARITLFISKIESDYLRIRGVDFELDDDENIVYPDDADIVAGEMVCYAMGLGDYQGRGEASESTGGASRSYDRKIYGYPESIVGTIRRIQSAR